MSGVIPLKQKRILADQANAAVAARKSTSALARTGQVARSTVAVGDDDVLLDDVLVSSVDTTIETGAQAGDIAFLDDDQVDSFDAVLAAGNAADVDTLLDAQEAEPDLGDEWEASADADDEAHLGRIGAIEVSGAVQAAQEDANQAAIDASFATETSLGNARYRLVDGGTVIPDEPEGGFRAGAQLVRVNATGSPYQVDRWTGTGWIRDQVLADQILIPGEGGTIAIGDATIYAPTVIGGKFYGNEFEGGIFSLPSVAAVESVVIDACESLGPWVPQSGSAAPTLSTVQKHGGTYSIIPGANSAGARYMKRPIGPFTFPRGGYASVWMRRATAGFGHLITDAAQGFPVSLEANVWTEVRTQISPGATVSSILVGGATAGTIYVDDLLVVRYTALAGKAAIDRTSIGESRVYSEAADGTTISFQDGALKAVYGTKGAFIRQLTSGTVWAANMGVSSNVDSVLRELYLDVREGSASLILTRNNLVVSDIDLYDNGDIKVRGTFRSAKDTDWATMAVPGGSGTLEWRRVNNEIKLRFDLTYSTAIAPGSVLAPAFTLPVEARPVVNSPILVQGAGTWPAEGFVSSSGAAAIRNLHTVALTRFYGSAQWPANS